jgi:hypothetical protein
VVGCTAKLPVPELSALNLGVIENVKEYKASVFDVILLELIEARSSAVCSELHKLFISNKKEIPQKPKSIIMSIYKKGGEEDDDYDDTNCSNYGGYNFISCIKCFIQVTI